MIVNFINIGRVILTGTATLAVVFLLLAGFLLWEYDNQKTAGNSFLSKLDFDVKTNDPLRGVGDGEVYVTVYQSSLVPNLDGTVKETHEINADITYTAYSYDNERSYKISTDSYKKETPRFASGTTAVDTSKLMEKVGNNAKVCAHVKVTYTEVNVVGIFGRPSRELGEKCVGFSGSFGN